VALKKLAPRGANNKKKTTGSILRRMCTFLTDFWLVEYNHPEENKCF